MCIAVAAVRLGASRGRSWTPVRHAPAGGPRSYPAEHGTLGDATDGAAAARRAEIENLRSEAERCIRLAFGMGDPDSYRVLVDRATEVLERLAQLEAEGTAA